MAGFREFAAGEPLTATNVDDFLMKQSVMKFADGAARDAALGTAVVSPNALREGMIAYLDDTDDVLKYDGSAWVTVDAAAIGSNVVQALKTDSFTSSSTSYVPITGLTATITPTTDTSKILVFVSCNIRGRYDINVRLKRGSTVIGNDPWKNAGQGNVVTNANLTTLLSALYLDSPATTSAVTYSVEAKTSISSAFVVNADQTPTNLQAEVVLIEVKA